MELKIEGMTCVGCAKSVAAAIRSVDANARVEAHPAAHAVRIETTAPPASILQALEDAGYRAAVT